MTAKVVQFPDSLRARASGFMHFYRKIGGGRAYQECSIYHGPDPEPGYEHYHTEPMLRAQDIHEFLTDMMDLALTEELGEEAGAYGPPCETCKGSGSVGIPSGPCHPCKGKGYKDKPDEHSVFIQRLLKMVDEHGTQRWETGFNEASPVATEKGSQADKRAKKTKRRIELSLMSYFVKRLFD